MLTRTFAMAWMVTVCPLVNAQGGTRPPSRPRSEFAAAQTPAVGPLTRASSADPLEQRLQAIEQELADLKQGGTAQGSEGSPIRLSYKKGLKFASQDGNFTMDFSGYAIENGRFFTQHSPNDNTFYNKETLFGWKATFAKRFKLDVEMIFGPAASMNNSFLDYEHNEFLTVRVGQWKQPFLLEETRTNVWRDFSEQAVTRRLAPSRGIGVGVMGKFFEKRLGYELAHANGTPKNTSDSNDEKETLGRLTLSPCVNDQGSVLRGLSVFAMGGHGQEDAATPNFGAASAATLPDTGTQFITFKGTVRYDSITRRGLGATFTKGPCMFIGEFASLSLDLDIPGASALDASKTRFDSWYVTAGWFITGEDAVINDQVSPKQPFVTGADGGWGAWQVRGRLSGFQVEREPFATRFASVPQPTTTGVGSATDVESWTTGLSWIPVASAKVMLDYGQNHFDSDYVGPLGAETRQREQFVLLSTQVKF